MLTDVCSRLRAMLCGEWTSAPAKQTYFCSAIKVQEFPKSEDIKSFLSSTA